MEVGVDCEAKESRKHGRSFSAETSDGLGDSLSPTPATLKSDHALVGSDPKSIKGWRRANLDDISDIEELISITEKRMNLLYNVPRLENLIEKCFFPIVQFDHAGRMVSFTAYEYFPNVPAVPAFSWVEWIRNVYGLTDADARNSLFVHYMVWHPSQGERFLRLVIETAFLEFINVRYVIVVKPPLVEFLLPINIGDSKIHVDSLQSINICIRCSVVERLRFRKAVAEDSDALMSLFKSRAPRIEELYGEFFFAELVEHPGTDDRHVIVCEVNGVPAGIICINLSADLDFLNEEFELLPYHGLKKIVLEDLMSENPSIGTMYLGDRAQTIYERANSKEIDFINVYASVLDKSILELKKSEDSGSGRSTDSDTLTIRMPELMLSAGGDDDDDDVSVGNASPTASSLSVSFGYSPVDKVSRDLTSTDEFEARRNQNVLSMDASFFPRYNGASNAFAIELFALDNDIIDERASIEFLEAAFASAPDREYCIITIPTHLLPIPLLTHFVKADRRYVRQLRHELYICPRSSFSTFEVKELESSDMDALKYFIHRVYYSDIILEDFRRCFKANTTFRGFGLFLAGRIVGIALLCHDEGVLRLPVYYDVAKYAFLELHDVESQFVLVHYLLDPKYQSHSRLFLMDAMRLADATCLYHAFYDNAREDISLLSNLGDMRPVKPRKLVNESLFEDCPASDQFNFSKAFALFLTSSRMCGRSRAQVNKMIVVVGASVTAMSFFENMIFGYRASVCFNNLIWISRHGAEQEAPIKEMQDLMFPIRNKYDMRYRKMMSLKSHVHFIYGLMTGINRDEKYVVVNENSVIKYDVLILTLGVQFATPTPEVQSEKVCQRNRYARSTLARFLAPVADASDEPAQVEAPNMFIINTYYEANNALIAFEYIKERLSAVTPENKIIVYGHSMRIFTFMNALLKLGIPGDMIAFVEPFPSRDNSTTVFEDDAIDRAVVKAIKQCKINHYREYFLYDWTFGAGNQIATISFHSRNSQVTLQCLAFVPMVSKLVADVNFKACNNAGLVYDGRLVIDRNFRTNDGNIFAAGPFTKYSRRYCAPEKAHQYYSSTEIGEKLSEIIRCELGASRGEEGHGEDVRDGDLVPVMTEPVMVYSRLPGEYNYFLLRQPGKAISLEDAFNYGVCGDVLVTGDCDMSEGRGYFRLILDPRGCVMSISCFTKKEIKYKNLCMLYGLNEKILNNLLVRYDNAMIADFYEFFDEPWANALYHHDVSKLRQSNVEKFVGARLPDRGKSFDEKLEEAFDPRSGTYPDSKAFDGDYESAGIKSAVARNVVDFLGYYNEELPTYASPPVLQRLYKRKDEK